MLTVFFSSRISPWTSTVIFLVRSPSRDGGRDRGDVADLAGQVAGHEVDVVGQVLPRAGDARHARPGRRACLRVPTSRATRVTSAANDESWSTIVLMVFFSSRISPWTSTVIFFVRSPRATAVVTAAMLRTWPVRLPAIELTLSVRSFHVPDDAFDARLAAELAFGADLARHARHFRGERAELIDHRVDGVLQLEELALDVDGDLLRQIAVGDGRGDFGDVAHLRGQVAGHQVDVVGEVLPRAGDALHDRPGRRACLRCRPRAPRG